jgi:thioesterase domain-containing protein
LRHKFFTVLRGGVKKVVIVAKDTRLVELQSFGAGAPFFLVNSYPYFIDVVKLLGADHPVITLAGQEDPEEAANYSIAEEAAAHVESILNRQPQGPYMLGGCSASGIVAYEIAQQLLAKGHEVGLLVVFDVPNPYFMKEYSRFHRSLAYHRAALAGMRWHKIPGWLIGKFAGVAARRLLRSSSQSGEIFELGAFPPRVEAARKYRPKDYNGAFLLFKGRPCLRGRYLNPRLGWGEVVRGKIEVVQLGAINHIEIFKSELDRALVAQKLRESFAQNAAAFPNYRFSAQPVSEHRIGSLASLG